MKRVRKIRIYPNMTQVNIIHGTLGCCRYIQNMFIAYNRDAYENGKKFVSGYDFSKIVNKLKKEEPDYFWIANYSSKAIKDSIMNIEKSYKNFFKKKGGYPHFKSRKRIHKESFFFIKNNIHYIDKNHIKIPILGKVRITESNYLPDIQSITSGRVIREYDKYYVLLIYETKQHYINKNDIELGIDVGIKSYATISNNFNTTIIIDHFKELNNYKRLNEKIIKLQQIISYKAEINYGKLLNKWLDKHKNEELTQQQKNIMKGESYNSSNIRRLKRKIRVLKYKQSNIRKDFIYKLVDYLTAKTKPKMITIENLDVSEITRHKGTRDATLHKYIMESAFYKFKSTILYSCEYYGIKLRIADKYFASSKICSCCGKKNKKLTLNDRIFICKHCGLEIDRDENASINLLNMKNKNCMIYDFA